MIAFGYVLKPLCECCDALGVFEGQTRAEAMREAKRAHWTVDFLRRRAWCPRHHAAALEALGVGTPFRPGPRRRRARPIELGEAVWPPPPVF